MRTRVMFTTITICFFAIILLTTCKKDNVTAIATILNTSTISDVGCGFVVRIEGSNYHADNLDSEYQQDSLKVYVSVKQEAGIYQCGSKSTSGITIIHINQIAKVNQ